MVAVQARSSPSDGKRLRGDRANLDINLASEAVMLARILAAWIALFSCQSATAAAQFPLGPPTTVQISAELADWGEAAWLVPAARKGIPIGEIFGVFGEVVIGLFRFVGALFKGIFEGIAAVVKGIGHGAGSIVNSVKLAFHGGKHADQLRQVEHVPAGASEMKQAARAGEPSRNDALASLRESAQGSSDDSRNLPGNRAGGGQHDNKPLENFESLGRFGNDVDVRLEVEQLNKQCGRRAAGVAGANYLVVKGCMAQVQEVRKACSRQGASEFTCREAAEEADDDCDIENTAEFFLELASACHTYALARR